MRRCVSRALSNRRCSLKSLCRLACASCLQRGHSFSEFDSAAHGIDASATRYRGLEKIVIGPVGAQPGCTCTRFHS